MISSISSSCCSWSDSSSSLCTEFGVATVLEVSWDFFTCQLLLLIWFLCKRYQHYVFYCIMSSWGSGWYCSSFGNRISWWNSRCMWSNVRPFPTVIDFLIFCFHIYLELSHSNLNVHYFSYCHWSQILSSLSLSILFIMDCVDVPLLSSDIEFLFLKMLSTLFLSDLKGLSWLFHLLYFEACMYTHPPEMCVLQSSCGPSTTHPSSDWVVYRPTAFQ